MATKKPLVLNNAGIAEELQAGDVLDTPPAYIPSFTATPTMLKLLLASNQTLTVYTQGGTGLSIPVST